MTMPTRRPAASTTKPYVTKVRLTRSRIDSIADSTVTSGAKVAVGGLHHPPDRPLLVGLARRPLLRFGPRRVARGAACAACRGSGGRTAARDLRRDRAQHGEDDRVVLLRRASRRRPGAGAAARPRRVIASRSRVASRVLRSLSPGFRSAGGREIIERRRALQCWQDGAEGRRMALCSITTAPPPPGDPRADDRPLPAGGTRPLAPHSAARSRRGSRVLSSRSWGESRSTHP